MELSEEFPMSAEDELREALVESAAPTTKLDDTALLRMREDVVPKTYRGLVQKCTRIDAPFLNVFLMREVGNIFTRLGQDLIALSRKPGLDETHRLIEGYMRVRAAQRRILYLRGGKSVSVKMMEE